MPKIRLHSAEEVNRSFAPLLRRALREEEMRPYREAARQLGPETPGGVIELGDDEDPQQAILRMHRAAREAGWFLRFQRRGRARDRRELRFRLQSPEETMRLQERGALLARARQAKGGKAAEDRAEAEC